MSFLFEKALTPSDVGKLNRLVIPKQHAERCFPLDVGAGAPAAQMLTLTDEAGKAWSFRYSYWHSSQSFVLTKGWNRFVKEKQLKPGDVVVFAKRDENECFIYTRRGTRPGQAISVLLPTVLQSLPPPSAMSGAETAATWAGAVSSPLQAVKGHVAGLQGIHPADMSAASQAAIGSTQAATASAQIWSGPPRGVTDLHDRLAAGPYAQQHQQHPAVLFQQLQRQPQDQRLGQAGFVSGLPLAMAPMGFAYSGARPAAPSASALISEMSAASSARALHGQLAVAATSEAAKALGKRERQDGAEPDNVSAQLGKALKYEGHAGVSGAAGSGGGAPVPQALPGRIKCFVEGSPFGVLVDVAGYGSIPVMRAALLASTAGDNIVYQDRAGDLLILGDEPWDYFLHSAQKLFITRTKHSTVTRLDGRELLTAGVHIPSHPGFQPG